jgi:Domain of unknown function (DUF4476)
MKTVFTILTLCLITITSFAYRGATLKIRDAEGRKIMVAINGKKFPNVGRIITVGDVPSGRSMIKIYAMRNNGNRGGYNNNNGNGYNNNSGRNNKPLLIYSGIININTNNIYRCTVDDFEGMNVQTYCCTNNNGIYNLLDGDRNNQFYNYDDQDQYWNENFWGNENGQWRNYLNQNNNQNTFNNHDDHDGHNHDNNWNNNNNNTSNWNNNNNQNNNQGNFNNNAMNSQTFQAFKRTVENNNFDSGKLTIIKTQLQNTWITAAQLRELVDVFNFESSKVDVAKYGATRVVDKQNLFTIYDSFSFESSKTELATYFATLR